MLANFVLGAEPSPSNPAPAKGTSAGGGGFSMLLIYVLLIGVIFYFFLILPQKRRDKKFGDMLKTLKKGDKIVTLGGIYGKVTQIKANTVKITIAQGVEVEISKKAISSIAHSSSVPQEVKK